MAIKRGTTPTHTITTDIDLRNATEIYITYEQLSYKVVEKSKTELKEVAENYLKVQLSQEETLRFKEKGTIYIQLRAIFSDGNAVSSNVMETTPFRLLKEGVI